MGPQKSFSVLWDMRLFSANQFPAENAGCGHCRRAVGVIATSDIRQTGNRKTKPAAGVGIARKRRALPSFRPKRLVDPHKIVFSRCG